MIKSTYSGRGSGLEEQINTVNEIYRERGLGLVQKIPTPITPIKQKGSQITRAFFAQKSTVDYIGVVQGNAICFDAKECHTPRIPLNNFKDHQIRFMEDFEKQDGIAFFLVYFAVTDEYFYLPLRTFESFAKRASEGGLKSIAPDDIDPKYKLTGELPAHYLTGLNTDIESRKEV